MNRKHEMSHVVYSGWMVKSPPEKKLTGPWKIFRAWQRVCRHGFSMANNAGATVDRNSRIRFSGDMSNRSKWKRRYFVLSKPASSLPGTYLLSYFSDENCKKLRGTIDLEQCAEIIESLDSDQFQYLLAIKTTHKGRERTYFLATETEEQMSTWVRNLCTVCGMKPDETDESPQPPIREDPPPRRSQPTSSFPSNAHGVMARPDPTLLEKSGIQGNSPSPSSRQSQRPTNPRPKPAEPAGEDYIPLEECTSGTAMRPGRQVSTDSAPDEKAPPIPPLKGVRSDSDDNVFVNNSSMYDILPPTAQDSAEEDDLYKVPPVRAPIGNDHKKSAQDMYDIPPHYSPNTSRSSGSDIHPVDTFGQDYDTPPTREALLQEDDVYDVPPSHSKTIDEDTLAMVPPVRPPKPSYIQDGVVQLETYMNLPTNSKVYSDKNKVDIYSIVQHPSKGLAQMSVVDLYDTPRSNPSECLTNAKKSESKEKLSATVPPPSMCVPPEHKYVNSYGGPVEQDVYLPMDTIGTGSMSNDVRKSSSTDNEVEYTDMSGKSSFDDSFEGRQLYDHPPPSRPQVPPPRPAKSSAAETGKDTYSIFSSSRTRSFKKKAEGSPLIKKKSPLASNNTSSLVSQTNVPLPQRVDRHPDFSTSDEDDDDVMGNTDVWGTTPPAPSSNKETELKYVDLDHDDTTPARSPHTTTKSPTEYHDIDFVKTDALKNVKEKVSVERSKEKQNT